ncbi:MAG: ACP S-malonyltransferase [Chloroflexi bacterium]|nr:ACP S-malonyltransferase [Chloroflexota bacterium]
MAAIIGLPAQAVADLVAEANADAPAVWIANDNAPGQIVIAGRAAALERALALARERGAKRAVPLAVSVACHTPLMAPAAERLANALEQTPLVRPWTPVLQNATARATSDPVELRAALLQQLTAPVRWVESIRSARASGVDTFVEIGPRSVLAGLIGRIDSSATVHTLTDADALRAFAWED